MDRSFQDGQVLHLGRRQRLLAALGVGEAQPGVPDRLGAFARLQVVLPLATTQERPVTWLCNRRVRLLAELPRVVFLPELLGRKQLILVSGKAHHFQAGYPPDVFDALGDILGGKDQFF